MIYVRDVRDLHLIAGIALAQRYYRSCPERRRSLLIKTVVMQKTWINYGRWLYAQR